RSVCAVAVPDGGIINNDVAGFALGDRLGWMISAWIDHDVPGHARPMMRARHKTGGTVIGTEVIKHDDKTEKSHLARNGLQIDMQFLWRGKGLHRSAIEEP